MFADARAAYRARALTEREVIPDFGTARWKKFAPNETGRRRKMTKTRREIDAARTPRSRWSALPQSIGYEFRP